MQLSFKFYDVHVALYNLFFSIRDYYYAMRFLIVWCLSFAWELIMFETSRGYLAIAEFRIVSID